MIYYHKCHVNISKHICNILRKKTSNENIVNQIQRIWLKDKNMLKMKTIMREMIEMGNPTIRATNPINSYFGYSIFKYPFYLF